MSRLNNILFPFSLPLFLACFCLLLLKPHTKAFAKNNEFSTSLESTYSVDDKGSTNIEQKFSIRNNLSTVYVSEYALEVGSPNIHNVKAVSNGVVLEPKVTNRGSKTGVALVFPNKIVGKDQVREFTLSYQSNDIVSVNGKIIEINIPKLQNPNDFDSYKVNITTKNHYEAPSLVFPDTYTSNQDGDKQTISFNDVGQTYGIRVLFGLSQTAELELQYSLSNSTSQKGVISVALPPDTSTQRVVYTKIEPKPNRIIQDRDGNWLAEYLLNPNQQLDVKAELIATLSLESQSHSEFVKIKPTKHDLQSTHYWPVNNPRIKQLAR